MALNSQRSRQPPLSRKTVKPTNLQIPDAEAEAERWLKLDEMIRYNIAIIQLNDIHLKEAKLKSREQELRAKVEKLTQLKEQYDRLKNENDRIQKALHEFQVLSEAVNHAKDFDEFAKMIEPYCTEPIPLNMDEDQFKIFSDKIRSYNERSGPLYENINEIRNFIQSISELEIDDSITDICQPETYQQIKRLNAKCNEQIKRLTDLPESIRNLQQISTWISSNFPKSQNENSNLENS